MNEFCFLVRIISMLSSTSSCARFTEILRAHISSPRPATFPIPGNLCFPSISSSLHLERDSEVSVARDELEIAPGECGGRDSPTKLLNIVGNVSLDSSRRNFTIGIESGGQI